MEMQQRYHHMVNSPPLDFNAGRSSPCSTTGGGGGRFNFISAPTSPSRASEFYRDFDDFSMVNQMEQEHEFAFHVSKDQSSEASVSAEELFDHGTIRSPMAQQPHHLYRGGVAEPPVSIKSPLLSPSRASKPKGRKSFWSAFALKDKNHTTVKPSIYAPVTPYHQDVTGDQERGRERGPPLSTSASGRRVTRSLSPTRAPPTMPAPTKNNRRWKLTNFLLFRSASEGRASDKDPMRKLTSFYKRSSHEEMRASTSRTAEINQNSNSNNVAPIRRSGQPISAHERHYTTNKAASKDLKKKTFLPYKQGILGPLAVNANVHAN